MSPGPFFDGRILQCLGSDGFAFVSEQFHTRDSLIEKHHPAAPRSCSVRGNARELAGNSRMASISVFIRPGGYLIFGCKPSAPTEKGSHP